MPDASGASGAEDAKGAGDAGDASDANGANGADEAKRKAEPPAPSRPGRRGRGLMPEPSEATRNRPVPKPARPRRPRPMDQDLTARATSPPAPGAVTRQMVSKTTRPGVTQASTGGAGSGRAGFVKQKIRDEDRVNVNIDVAVSYRFVARDGTALPAPPQDRQRGKLLDISMGGAQVEGPVPPEVPRDDLKRGTVTVEAVFELPYVDKPLEVVARVNWMKPSGPPLSCIGLRFLKPADEQRRIIRAFLIGLQSPARRKKFRR